MTPARAVQDSPVLDVADLRVDLHREGRVNHALRGVDLVVLRGEIVALVGESGSGKSTLGYAVQGLLPAESSPVLTGSVLVDGTQVVGASRAVLRRLRRDALGAVFQDPMTSLDPTMRVGKQVAEAIQDDASVVDLLEQVGIADAAARVSAYPHQLSGGQRQRVMIAMAMAAHPALVIADEPTTALDVTVQARVLDTFRRLRDVSGTAFVFITHDLAVAAAVADRIVVLYGGRVVEQGPVDQVVQSPAHPYTAALLQARFGLDADKDRQLPTLSGAPPDPGGTPQGCSFAPRCLLAEDACSTSTPPLRPVEQHDGAAACLRSQEVDPLLWRRTARDWPSGRPGDATAPSVVEARALVKTYRVPGRGGHEVHALRGVDLHVADGEAVALVGESGSGKSTLLRLVAGLIEPTSGEVRVTSRERPQMVYQDASASLTPWLTVEELVGERFRSKGLSRSARREAVIQALDRVGLPADLARVRPGQLSGGQRQRVAVARAVAVPPRLLLCDEPVSAMDVSLAASVLNLLESLRRELRMAMLFVTHDLAAARFVADRVVVMRAGAIVEEGPADRVVREPAADYTRELLASMPEHLAVT